MSEPVIIKGHCAGGVFIPDEPIPAIAGEAELILTPESPSEERSGSIFDLFGAAPRLKSQEEIDEMMKEIRGEY
jgi:hypothetical protein